MSNDWTWPGSRWWRLDLHTHSPASYDFGEQADRDALDWSRWVRAARDVGLDAVAITDHNTAAAIGHLKEVTSPELGAATLFPGVELTASCGTHLLIILDPDSSQDHVDEFLSLADISTQDRGSRTASSTKSVEQILDLANQGFSALILGAHVNGPKGLLEHDGQQRIRELRHPNLCGVEVDPTHGFDETWIDGSRLEIGRRLPRVWCSDAHHFDDIGRCFTWVKMTRPNLEGLSLALLDGDSSSLLPVTLNEPGDPNRHASLVIESVRIRNAKFMGRTDALEVCFNPWLNTIIGSRGTGKSTLLDFCRMSLRREMELDGSLRETFDRRLSVPRTRRDEGLLTDSTCLEIIYRKDGERFLISWDQRGETPAIQRFDGRELRPESGDVQERFPVRIYSQKQLFELAQDPNALLRVIDDSKSVRGSERAREIKDTEDRFLSLCAAERAARTRASDLASRRVALEDVKRKLDILQRGGGTQAMAAYRKARQQNNTWQSILTDAEGRIAAVANASEELTVADLDLGASEEGNSSRDALRRLHARLLESVTCLKQAIGPEIDRARRDIGELSAAEDADSKTWKSALDDCQAEYEKAAEQLAKDGISSPDEYRNLVEQAAAIEKDIRTLENEAGRAEKLRDEAVRVLVEHREKLDAWSQARSDFAGQASSTQLKVIVKAHGGQDREAVGNALRERLGIQKFDADYDAFAGRIVNDDMPWSWDRLDTVICELRKAASGQAEQLTFQDRRFRAAIEKLPPERIDRLALLSPEDGVEVSFRDANGPWSPLSQGSPGQQTAALLAFVLGYGDEPILLDQPEDDLDNTLIYKVLVQRLRDTKATRQVIVVTHNPNIVVHGDAELILSLDARRGQTRVACQGGLQERAVRDEICRVMEGGKEAFEDRYRRMMPVRGRPR